ncbi:uncharacterized protein LOC128682182 isoform X2 [Plodia interpunctella]|nr:uncharacterized protein LOC128682182 isoform X2 [Plodia interpunctella]
MAQDVVDSYTYIDAYYVPIMHKKIKEMLGVKDDEEETKKTTSTTTTTTAPPPADTTTPEKQPERKKHDEEEEMTDVQKLDDYVSNSARILTVPEINSFANLGFEFAGKLIHGMIGNLGGASQEETEKYSKGADSSGSKGAPANGSKQHNAHKVTNDGSTVHGPVEQKATQDDTRYRANDKTARDEDLSAND